MLTLTLFPAEFRVLIQYLRFNTAGQDQVPLTHQSVSMLLMIAYLKSISVKRLITWNARRNDKQFRFSLPLPIALAIYQDMQQALLTSHQQLLLAKIDQAVINYRDPAQQAHALGELIGH